MMNQTKFRSSRPLHPATNQRRPADMTDSHEVAQIEKRLQDTADRLAGMVEAVGAARQIKEFAGDRRKQLLAKSMCPFLEAGESATAAEAKARASFVYDQEMTATAQQLKAAETCLANWEATKVQWESARSLLAMQRQMGAM